MRVCSVVSDSSTPWTVAHQASLSMEFSRQEYRSGLPFPPPGDLPDLGIEPMSPASPSLQEDSSLLSHRGSPQYFQRHLIFHQFHFLGDFARNFPLLQSSLSSSVERSLKPPGSSLSAQLSLLSLPFLGLEKHLGWAVWQFWIQCVSSLLFQLRPRIQFLGSKLPYIQYLNLSPLSSSLSLRVFTPLKNPLGTSRVVQWLRPCAPNAGVPGSTLGQGTRFCVPQLRPSSARLIN